MVKDYKRLGDFIQEIDVRNRDLSVTELMGININKHFMPSVANVIGTDLSNYKIVSKMQFACNLMHVGRDEKIPMAMLTEDSPIIVSPAYFVFEVIDTDLLLPEYLMMWFSRKEFDRNAWFYTDADVRGGMGKETLLDMKLPIPSIERQREIVAEYETLSKRISLNEQLISKLEQTAQTLYRKMFVEGIDKENLPEGWRMGAIGNFGEVITGKTPSSENPEDFGGEMPFITPGDFTDYKKFAIGAERMLSDTGVNRLKTKILRKGAVIVTCIGSDMGKVAIASEECITNQQMNSIAVNCYEYSDYLFYGLSLMSKELKSMALGSSTMPMLNKSDFERIPIAIPPYGLLKDFSKSVHAGNDLIILKSKENSMLTKLQSLLLARMGKSDTMSQ